MPVLLILVGVVMAVVVALEEYWYALGYREGFSVAVRVFPKISRRSSGTDPGSEARSGARACKPRLRYSASCGTWAARPELTSKALWMLPTYW